MPAAALGMTSRFPPTLLKKFSLRLDALVSEGGSILADAQTVPPAFAVSAATGETYVTRAERKKLDWSRFVEWRTKAATVLTALVPANGVHRESVLHFPKLKPGVDQLGWGIAVLKAIKDDLTNGFLDALPEAIEAEISADYLGQAERLLSASGTGRYDHVPAAVLAGAVLEKHLRSLCAATDPAVPATGPKGEPKTLGPLIEDLKKVGVLNEMRAKQLRYWAGIRNHAAHGEFDQFARADVEEMLRGISNFIAAG